MRKQLNSNPMVQLGVIVVLVIGVGFLMLTRLSGHKKPASTESDASGISSAVSSTLPPPATSSGTIPATSSAPPPAAVVPSSTSLIPGPGLPANVVSAWKGGDAIVLLIVRNGGTDDRLVRGAVRGLSSDPEISVFVSRARDIARYSRITQGVGVDRVPALVVVRPQRLSGGVPQATVSYGFRDSKSVLQAIEDALYSGRDDIPYYPG
jgi:hypothetical protein